MSKSKATAIHPSQIVDTFGSDAYRYYFTRTIAFGSDGNFSWEHLSAVYTSELANGLGNLASRVTAMVGKYFDGVLPEATASGPAEQALADALTKAASTADAAIERVAIHEAVGAVADFVGAVNVYVTEQEPWKVAKDDSRRGTRPARDRSCTPLPSRCAPWRCCTTPVMPKTSAALWSPLGADEALGPLADQRVADVATWGAAPGRGATDQGRGRCSRGSTPRTVSSSRCRGTRTPLDELVERDGHDRFDRRADAGTPWRRRQRSRHDPPPAAGAVAGPGRRQPLPPRHPGRRRLARRRRRRSSWHRASGSRGSCRSAATCPGRGGRSRPRRRTTRSWPVWRSTPTRRRGSRLTASSTTALAEIERAGHVQRAGARRRRDRARLLPHRDRREWRRRSVRSRAHRDGATTRQDAGDPRPRRARRRAGDARRRTGCLSGRSCTASPVTSTSREPASTAAPTCRSPAP